MGLLSQLAQPASATMLVARMVVLNVCIMTFPFWIVRVIYPVSPPTPASWEFSWQRRSFVALVMDLSIRVRVFFHGMALVLAPLRPSSKVTDDPSMLARYLFRGGGCRSFTARVQRGPSEAARCASIEDHQASPSSLLRERGVSTDVISSLSCW